jgi:predicted O-methyltransferase YrrM
VTAVTTVAGEKWAEVASIMETAAAFWRSKVLLTAAEFDLFTKLGTGWKTGEQLRGELGLHPRGVWDFLDSLVAMGFLERRGDGGGALYGNTPEGLLYLDANSPRYLGGTLKMLNARLFRFWQHLPEALTTGQPQNEARHGEANLFEELYREERGLEGFLDAMTGFSRLNFELFAERFDFSRFRTLTDIGGATGLLSIEVAKRHPHMECISFDLPQVEPVARKAVAKAGLDGRVQLVSGDFFRDPLPPAEVLTMGMILHDWNLERKQQLIRAAHDALPEGGALVTIEAIIDDARRENVFGLLMSLNMLIEFGDAFDYSAADFEGWCRAAGFRAFERIPLAGPSSAVVAYK